MDISRHVDPVAPRWPVGRLGRLRRLPSFSIITLLFLLAPGTRSPIAVAQENIPKPGDQIRVTTSVLHYAGGKYVEENPRYVGTLVELNHDSMRWDSEGSPYNTPLDQIAKLELVRGQKSNAGKGAFLGGVVGLGVGAAVGLVFSGLCGMDQVSDNAGCRVGTTAVAGGLGAVLGAGVGALIGNGSKSVRWETVPPETYRGSP